MQFIRCSQPKSNAKTSVWNIFRLQLANCVVYVPNQSGNNGTMEPAINNSQSKMGTLTHHLKTQILLSVWNKAKKLCFISQGIKSLLRLLIIKFQFSLHSHKSVLLYAIDHRSAHTQAIQLIIFLYAVISLSLSIINTTFYSTFIWWIPAAARVY